MRKAYTKPNIVFDSFNIDMNIAACAKAIGEHGQGSCAANVSGFMVFTSDISGCTFTQADGDDNVFHLCYYVSSADQTLFGS